MAVLLFDDPAGLIVCPPVEVVGLGEVFLDLLDALFLPAAVLDLGVELPVLVVERFEVLCVRVSTVVLG